MTLLLSGPDLPTVTSDFSMVESSNGILAIGGYGGTITTSVGETDHYLKSIHRLSCKNVSDCQWIKEGELNHARGDFNVIPYTEVGQTTATNIDSDTLLQSHFHLLTLLGYGCLKNSETSFRCEEADNSKRNYIGRYQFI